MDPNLPNNPTVPPATPPIIPTTPQITPSAAVTENIPTNEIPAPSIQSPINQPIEPPKPKSSLILIISLIVLIGSLLALSWYFLSQKVIIQTPVTSYEECINAKDSLLQETYPTICVTKSGERFTEPISSPIPTPDIATGWKIFVGNNYQLKYPDNLTYEERVKGYFAFLADPKNKTDIMFTIDERTSTKKLETFKTEEESSLISPKISDLTNDNFQGFVSEGTVGPGFGEGLYVKAAYIDINGKVVIISCDVNKTCQETLLNQILSTFKLLEATPSGSPTASPTSSPSSSLQ